ncbi:uncharacterized protein DUF2786 [Haloactinopolyspora alba]|uniref:Uncharacterized protein DUF2786 n=1 Tax=Haloactinopolyspora alba TaxID=648780 RepID=A0A2P8E742_9ACTN|nr:DUF2786 domain-containing protein [Haloactinopolyspora alba]PSL05294.1 uncharacterized protein DUF2786 [Haloactinopolyspora alba]
MAHPEPPSFDDDAVVELLRQQLESLCRQGWLPVDLVEIVRRRASGDAVSFVVDAVADWSARHPAATMHPRWSEQLRTVGATVWWDARHPYPGQWAARWRDGDRRVMLTAALDVLGVLRRLPPLQRIVPAPGEQTSTAGTGAAVDDTMLTRVRALLAKAESTTFPDEAEALSAKAQELMSRYSIEQSVAAGARPAGALASARRIWLDAPYVGPKTLLVGEVGSANHCRTVSSERLGFTTVLGDDVALDVVEVLATSLLVQATSAMVAAGTHGGADGRSRTRSFRHSFLLSYATRIGERLRDTAGRAEAEAGTDLVAIHAERHRAVDELYETLFPTVAQRSFTAGSSAGWGAGRSAADQAELTGGRRELDVGS